MTPYRQPIRLGNKGLDVLAVKRALRRMGVSDRGLILSDKAGGNFVRAIRTVQHAHRIKPDGVYGRLTHSIVAPHFDGYGDWLYRHASIRRRQFYRNPFARARIVPGRIDMGVDFHGRGPILAIGDAEVLGDGGGGWPGRHYLLYRLLNGPHADRHVYVAEGIRPVVRHGHVSAGQEIGYFDWDAYPGNFPGIETGWSSPELNRTLAAEMGRTNPPTHADTPAGLAFARFLHQLGTPLSWYPGTGPTYPG